MPHHTTRADDIALNLKRRLQWAWTYACGPGRQIATRVARRVLARVGANLAPRRVLSLPHLLVLFWMVILLWGERWVFDSKVANCDWDHWEDWPRGAHPHRLIFVADPQIIDAHSYPGRPWPLSTLTTVVTDNYLLRGYRALQSRLNPDSLFFLGDLFDGGREWKTTHHGEFVDPTWGRQRPGDEKKWVDTWHHKYGENYWLREYERFGNIFFDHYNDGGESPGEWQRGKKLVASLPGNHDLGFGAQVQIPVRDRFEAFFGEANRVDIVGNHTVVSVDSVSLSADSSEYKNTKDLTPIYGPVNDFLDGVKSIKRKAVQEELALWHGGDRELQYDHHVEDLMDADLERLPKHDPGPGTADFPTILLTHVPLWREAGTPCGPQREHWPPAKPAKGSSEPVFPDHRNALTIVGGYQYQNVLSLADSNKLLDKIGNVVNVFSGDDHDYCEVVHAHSSGSVLEITVKSLSMAMGVPTPGFQMVSLWNPVDEKGRTIAGEKTQTVQTRMCLLPNQLQMYMKYIGFFIFTLVLLATRATLVPVLNLTPFALDPLPTPKQHAILPTTSKSKLEPPDLGRTPSSNNLSSSTSSLGARNRSSSLTANGRWHSSKQRGGGLGPRINLDEDFYDTRRKGTDGRRVLGVVGREMWTGTWRVVWMAVLFWLWLARER